MGATKRRPDVTIGTDAATWCRLRQGELSGIEAFSQRLLYARGELDLALGFEGMFRLPDGRPPLLRIRDVPVGRLKVSTLTMGEGTEDVLLLHGLGGTKSSFFDTAAALSRRYRVHALDFPGFGGSSKPPLAPYDAAFFARTVVGAMDAMGIDRAHIVGNSMGGFAALHFGMACSPRALSLVVAGCGYGARPDQYKEFQAQARELAQTMLDKGMAHVAATYGHNASRLQLREKDPRGFDEFIRNFSEHSAQGSANTMLGYQARRPSLYDLVADMARIAAPVLIVAGDEDDAVLEPSLLMKRSIPTAGLVVLPKSGHMTNLENPALFNGLLEDFFHQVESGRWPVRPAPAA
jgi:pimeloyl-ACP methyl ester carboxylesterase